ncbi:MAG: UDP-3-O-(3-hydroxymyristoyl)glucosamine N-acyltransferase [Firmicutes bacterium]|nr:UDP-3-O-(3-hydroxymyristoyl)glucosamine N-acyltransferase [Bacillota bacterium]
MIKSRASITLTELAEILGGKLKGENITINDIAGIDDVEPGEITWVEDHKTLDKALESWASALIASDNVYEKFREKISIPCITVQKPRVAFAKTLGVFYERHLPDRSISESAKIGKNVTLGDNVSIGEYAIICDNCVLGDNVTIFPHVYIGDGVTIGKGSIIYPFASVYDHCVLGEEVMLHSGTVIGADGFGFVEDSGTRYKIPQVGKVIIGNRVEIGANVTIDRATTGATTVGDGTKIDNLIMIGHNNHIGKNCVFVSQSGVAGSCEIGDNVTVAAQAGIAPHIKIGSNTVVAGRGGVTHDIPENMIVSGFPAKPHHEALRLNGALQRLPSLIKTIRDMEARIKQLEEHAGAVQQV